jgi:HK97 family phage prohead protease
MDRLEIKAALAVSDAGEITGNAWPFAEPDAVGDIITKNAFGQIPADLPMLFGHNPDDLVGTWSEVKATDEGLIVKGQLHLDQPRARSMRAMLRSSLLSGLSIGFRTIEAKQQGRNRVISALDLVECSLCRNPSHPRARVTSAKQFDSAAAIAAALNRATAQLKNPRG